MAKNNGSTRKCYRLRHDPIVAFKMILYDYDASGRRIAKCVDDVDTEYFYDGDHCIMDYAENGSVLRKYIYGPGVDQPIMMIDVNDANEVYFYHRDGLGSVIALSDAAGDTVVTYEYSIYGVPASSDVNIPNPFQFTGRRFDSETGLYYYRARMYNPNIGRFLQTDPIGYGDGMNWYAYCGNNPTGFTDPSGNRTVPSDVLYIDHWPIPADMCDVGVVIDWMSLPYRLDPGMLNTFDGVQSVVKTVELFNAVKGLNDLWKDRGNGFALLGKIVKPLGAVQNPAGWIAGKYLEIMTAGVNVVEGLALEDKKYWRAFIKIQPYKLEDNDKGERVASMSGKPYWVEVVGFRGAVGQTGWGYGNAYLTLTVADQAAYYGGMAYMLKQFHRTWPSSWDNEGGIAGQDYTEIYFKAPRGGWFYEGDTWLKAFLGVSSSGGPR